MKRRYGARVFFCAVIACLQIAASSAAAQPAAQPATGSSRILDDFASLSAWKPVASDGVLALLQPATGPGGAALRMDVDFGGTAGYAIARRALPLNLPPNYEITFYLRSDVQQNDLQFKFIDASGDNVWWYRKQDFFFPREWQLIRIKKRQIEFAWGPAVDHTLHGAATIELAVAAGRGGRGSVYISELSLRELPVENAAPPTPVVRATSAINGTTAAMAVDRDPATAWTSDPISGKTQQLTLDLGATREFGGLVLRWGPKGYASSYEVLLSEDGERWKNVADIRDGSGGPDALRLPEAEARYVRLVLRDGPFDRYSVAEIEVHDLAFGATANAFIAALAREAPRGTYPRAFYGEQSYWTLVGTDGGSDSGLLSEDGALELGRGRCSIEPFVIDGTRVVSWADVETKQFLVDSDLPMPGVTWRDRRWELTVTTFADASQTQARLFSRYDLTNRTAEQLELTLVLAVRPFQVNPPTQFLNTAGGVSPIYFIAWDGTSAAVDYETTIVPLRTPDSVRLFSLRAGPSATSLANGWSGGQGSVNDESSDAAHDIRDEAGLASAGLVYRLKLAPHQRTTLGLLVPIGASVPPSKTDGNTLRQTSGKTLSVWLDDEQRRVATQWREKLTRVTIGGPPEVQTLVANMNTALAHLLMSRDGPMLRPGTRAYARSWIRDGAMMSESMLRLGHESVAADFMRWYARHQFSNGKIPCCVDGRGADPVPENDSPGEFIFLADEIFRYTGDPAFLEAMWPRVESASTYLEKLRQSERNPAVLASPEKSFYGLLPASISHEGYAAKPVHSYWDDFWGLKGYLGAVDIATAVGEHDAAQRLTRQGAEFRQDLIASLEATATANAIDYLPASAELADFDPTSTSIAFAPWGITQGLPRARIDATFERYWRNFTDRRDGRSAWEDYTPYELRNVSVFVRLGWRERAHELLRFFLADRRPAAWNQWAEVVGRDARQQRFVGDMPHAWIASDFIAAVLDLFAFDRRSRRSAGHRRRTAGRLADGSGRPR